ncbi:MAG TPA: ATP-binding cassette domain-containing protein [Polyangiaceae bacterium]
MTLLRLDKVRKHRGGRLVLDDVELVVEAKERVVLLGANGSGKSTLIALVVGLLAPDRGTVTIDGVRLDRDRAAALARVGYAADRPDFPEHLRVDEWLALVASLRGAKVTPDVTVGLEAIERLPLRALSLGQKRRVAVACARIGNPPLLVLDEPTNALDAVALRALEGVQIAHAEAGGAVLCATHDAAFAARVGTRTVTMGW